MKVNFGIALKTSGGTTDAVWHAMPHVKLQPLPLSRMKYLMSDLFGTAGRDEKAMAAAQHQWMAAGGVQIQDGLVYISCTRLLSNAMCISYI